MQSLQELMWIYRPLATVASEWSQRSRPPLAASRCRGYVALFKDWKWWKLDLVVVGGASRQGLCIILTWQCNHPHMGTLQVMSTWLSSPLVRDYVVNSLDSGRYLCNLEGCIWLGLRHYRGGSRFLGIQRNYFHGCLEGHHCMIVGNKVLLLQKFIKNLILWLSYQQHLHESLIFLVSVRKFNFLNFIHFALQIS
jgi:hypothetical protein